MSELVQHDISKSVLSELVDKRLHNLLQKVKGITSKTRGTEGQLTTFPAREKFRKSCMVNFSAK